MTIRRLSFIPIFAVVVLLAGLTSASALAAPNAPDPPPGSYSTVAS